MYVSDKERKKEKRVKNKREIGGKAENGIKDCKEIENT